MNKKNGKLSRLLAVTMSLLLVLALLSACGGAPTQTSAPPATQAPGTQAPATDAPPADVPPVRIAAFYNLSGSGADNGNHSIRGAQMAADYINANGGIKSLGGAMIEIVPADTMSDTSQAKAVADRVLADDSILAGIGVGSSAMGLPMLPAFERAGVPFVANGISHDFTNQGYKTIFQFTCTATAYGSAQVDYINYLNNDEGFEITKFGALYEDTDAGVSTAKTNKEKVEAAGYEWVYEGSFTLGALTDASSIVVAMKNSGVQVIYITARDADIKVIVNAMQSLNYMPLIFGSGAGFLIAPFAQELGDAVEGIISVTSANFDLQAPAAQGDGWDTVAAEFEEKYGTYMPEHATGGYSATRMVAAALEASGTRDKTDLCDAIRGLDMKIFNGYVDFDETGTNHGAQVYVIQWQKDEDGKFRPRTVFPDTYAAAELQLDKLAIKPVK